MVDFLNQIARMKNKNCFYLMFGSMNELLEVKYKLFAMINALMNSFRSENE
jgi:hypothetical protein